MKNFISFPIVFHLKESFEGGKNELEESKKNLVTRDSMSSPCHSSSLTFILFLALLIASLSVSLNSYSEVIGNLFSKLRKKFLQRTNEG